MKQGSWNRALVVIPHCSGHVPYDVATVLLGRERLSTADRQHLEERHFLEADPYTDHLFHLPGAVHLCATVSRFVVDLNRGPLDSSINGVVKQVDFDGKALYPTGTQLRRAEQELRIRHFWTPYHAQIEQFLSAGAIDLVIDAHSMKPQGPLFGPDRGQLRPAFTLANLGDQHGRATSSRGWVSVSPDIAKGLANKLEDYASDLLKDWPARVPRVTLNTPFSGGGTLQTYCAPTRENAVPGLAIEINRALYLDSEGQAKWPEIDHINDVLRTLVADAVQMVRR